MLSGALYIQVAVGETDKKSIHDLGGTNREEDPLSAKGDG
jgi:hypothetical protein